MSYQPPGTLGVLRILAWNSLMRLFRAADVQKSKRQKEAAEGQPQRRQATKRKSGSGMMWLLVLMMPLFLMQASFMCFQAATNMAVATALLPTKGLTLPFISYGGSSLIACCALLALVLKIDRDTQPARGVTRK